MVARYIPRRRRRLGDDPSTTTWEDVREGTVGAPGVTIEADAAGNPVQTVTLTAPAATSPWLLLAGALAVLAILWVVSD